MPELAESFILTSQLAQLFGVPFVTDSQLKLPRRLELQQHGSGPYKLVIHDFVSICGDQSIEEELAEAMPTRVQHQGKKGWILWKTKNGVVETEIRYGMTGSFALEKTQHTRLEFKNATGSIYFNDIRKFGGIVTNGHPVAASATSNLNVEQVYYSLVEYRDSTIKELLTEQTFLLSGVGNYLANEVCFATKIHPDSSAGLVTFPEFEKILVELKALVTESVELGGCTLRDFKDVMGRPGQFQTRLRIYGKKTCPVCSGPVSVVRRPNATTSWVCPTCQDLRR